MKNKNCTTKKEVNNIVNEKLSNIILVLLGIGFFMVIEYIIVEQAWTAGCWAPSNTTIAECRELWRK